MMKRNPPWMPATSGSENQRLHLGPMSGGSIEAAPTDLQKKIGLKRNESSSRNKLQLRPEDLLSYRSSPPIDRDSL